jgi:hypothetical protein
MTFIRRIRLFLRDWWQEFPIAWSIARHRDCERNGGHRWGAATNDSLLGWSRQCGRCGTSETIATTTGSSTSVPYFTGGSK